MQNTLQHIGNFDLQNRIVIIFIKYISLLEYNEKNILTEKIFTDKEVLNFFKAIQTYEDESVCSSNNTIFQKFYKYAFLTEYPTVHQSL